MIAVRLFIAFFRAIQVGGTFTWGREWPPLCLHSPGTRNPLFDATAGKTARARIERATKRDRRLKSSSLPNGRR